MRLFSNTLFRRRTLILCPFCSAESEEDEYPEDEEDEAGPPGEDEEEDEEEGESDLGEDEEVGLSYLLKEEIHVSSVCPIYIQHQSSAFYT